MTRHVLVFVALVGMLTALGVLLAGHPRPDESSSAIAGVSGSDRSATSEAGEPGEAEPGEAKPDETKASASESGQPGAAEPTAEAVPPPAPPRTLRVVGLGWEVLAPGLLANGGVKTAEGSRVASEQLAVEFTVVDDMQALEARLARGGAVADGADVAILPLASFVHSYERTRALAPEVFFVVAFSNGRDALHSPKPELLSGSKLDDRLTLVATPGRASTAFAAFVLDLHGVAPERISLAAPETEPNEELPEALERSLAARVRGPLDARKLVLTSADTPKLLPFVAIAPASFIDAREAELTRFAKLWMAGAAQFDADVPAAARLIAAQPGAPETVALLEVLAYVRFATLDDNVRLAGLSGRSPLTLDSLFAHTWSLWRGLGSLSTPAPEHAPIANEVIARVALGEAGPIAASKAKPQVGERRRVLLSVEEPAAAVIAGRKKLPDSLLDEERAAIIAELGMLAALFERAELELRVIDDRRSAEALRAAAIDRFGIAPERLRVGARLRSGRARVLVHGG